MAQRVSTLFCPFLLVIFFAVLTMPFAAPVSAGITNGATIVEASCNQVFVYIDFPEEGFSADLVVTFEDPLVQLDLDSLIVTAQIIDPSDAAIKKRLPPGFFIPARFPILINIDPNPDATYGLIFEGSYTLDLETDNLDFDNRVAFRLLRAHDPSDFFEDFTRNLGIGSYRVRGASGAFSEFVLAADLRPPRKVIAEKILDLQDILYVYEAEIEAELKAALDAKVLQIEEDIQNGKLGAAILVIDDFIDMVEQGADDGKIDDFFDPNDPHSVTGLLVGIARSLRLSVVLLRQPAPPETAVRQQQIDLFDGSGALLYRLQVRVSFTDVHAIDLDDLVITAVEIDPTDPAILSRLPPGVVVPEEFPVLVNVEPSADAEQAFRGELNVEIRTNDLDFLPSSPLRLFKAEDSQSPFKDISGTMGVSSYRVRGASGAFSEFLIAEDQRTLGTVITNKLGRLSSALATEKPKIDPAVFDLLSAKLDEVTGLIGGGMPRRAKDALQELRDLLESNAGDAVPDLWHISDGRVNSAALLDGLAETLQFSLALEAGPLGADPADVNRDGKVDVQDIFVLIDRVYNEGQ